MADAPPPQSRTTRLRALFALALDTPVESLDAVLAAQASDDASLIAEVKGLLAAHAQASGFLSNVAPNLPTHTAVSDGAALDSSPARPPGVRPGMLVGAYEVLSVLGAGGMGEVYLARDTRLGRQVALKCLPAAQHHRTDRVRRFEQEARALSTLNHPNIVTIYEIVEAEAARFIAMELVQGHTLREVIGQCPETAAVTQLGRQVAEALRAAHAVGIIHRDIKPENIMVRADGYVKVLDFGLARLVPAGLEDVASPSAAKQVFGTVRYMSPEQRRGEDATSASDIFSLGLVLYELATGQYAFAGGSPIGSLPAASDVLLPPSHVSQEIPEGLDDLILEMLQRDLRLRPSAQLVATALTSLPIAGSRPDAAQLRMPKSRRNVVGRERERSELAAAYTGVKAGRGSMITVSGEPGAGKTALIEDFLAHLRVEPDPCRIARGRCSERLAGTDAYLPWLEALDSLLRDPGKAATLSTIKTVAPAWYLQIASFADEEFSADHRRAELASVSQERLKREMTALLHELSGQQPLVIFLDDLHWADVSTVDLLSFIADRLDDMRILVIATYRPSDLLLAKHPFVQVRLGLQARGVCRDLALQFLTSEDIGRYLAIEFPEHRFPRDLSERIHARTEGSPLFMTDLVRYLRDRAILAEEHGRWVLAQPLDELNHSLPESVRGMIEFKIAQLDPADRKLLAAASVQGYEFDSAVVAHVLSLDAADVEERLHDLEGSHAFVKLVEERQFPDRTLTSRYRFTHVLYQNVLYASLKPTRKMQFAAALAQALEGHWGKQSAAIANELAVLFETAREFSRAAEYFRIAALSASELFASREAEALARRGLAMIDRLEAGPERLGRELSTQLVLGNALVATLGYAAPEVEKAFLRAGDLCRQLGDTPRMLPVYNGLAAFHLVRGQARTALQIGQEFLDIAERVQDPSIIVAPRLVGVASFYLGDPIAARTALETASRLYEPSQHRSLTLLYGGEPEMDTRSYLGLTLWLLGYPDQAMASHQKALQIAGEVSHAHSRAHTLAFVGVQHQLRREWQRCSEVLHQLLALTGGQGLLMWRTYAHVMRGWVLAGQGDIAEGIGEMTTNLAGLRAFGAQLFQPYFLGLLAEAHGDAGQPDRGLDVLDQANAMIDKTEERFWDAELLRIRGELLAARTPRRLDDAEHHFVQAVNYARDKQTRSLELRAVTSLSRLRQKQGKREEARALLGETLGWFTEGFGTADLKTAQALLQQLS